MNTKSGLGRGFDSLIPSNFDNSILLDPAERIQKVDIGKVRPNPDQPRKIFDEAALTGLAGSIKAHGILQPLVVTADGKDSYIIVAGERRWRAAGIAKLKTVPVIVRTLKELEQLEIALVENVQRVDLEPLEQAMSIERLHQQFSVTYDQIAKRLGKSNATISNTVRLLQLSAEVQAALNAHDITEGHARAILSLKDYQEHQAELLQTIIKNNWSVRQAERYVHAVKAGAQEAKAVKARVDTETPETKALGKQLKTSVHIRRTAKGGRLEIGFSSDEELARIIEILQK